MSAIGYNNLTVRIILLHLAMGTPHMTRSHANSPFHSVCFTAKSTHNYALMVSFAENVAPFVVPTFLDENKIVVEM